LRSLSWRKKRRRTILINLIHEIDNLRYICGEIEEVYALVSNKVRSFLWRIRQHHLTIQERSTGTIFLSDCTPSLTSWKDDRRKPLLYHDFGTAITSSARRVLVISSDEETLLFRLTK